MRCCLRESDTSSASFLGTFPSRGRLLDAFENHPLQSTASAVHLGGLAACSHFAALLLGHYITSGPIAIGPLLFLRFRRGELFEVQAVDDGCRHGGDDVGPVGDFVVPGKYAEGVDEAVDRDAGQ